MFVSELFENKNLDPNVYGEMLPTSTVKRIVNTVMSQVDPGAKVTVKQSPEGYYIVRSEGLRLDFGITADGGDINANIVNAYSSYKGKNVVTEIFGQCFQAAEQLWGKPNRFVMSAHEDRGHGVWQHIAQKLGAEWDGSINEISDDLRRSYLNRAGKHVDRRLERIAAVRDRLNKGYEIYHADRPTNGNAIVDHFEADTPALARQYYEKFIRDYVSDVDFDLRLRRATGIMEGTNNLISQKIFFARSNKAPAGWSYDHVGFITQDGKQIQMSGHKGNDVYITNAVTDDSEFSKQNIKIVSLSKPVTVPATNSVGAENCGTFVANVLQANGINGIDTQQIYSVFKKPLNEITMVNTQSKSKRQHTDVLPNDGKPIPKGQEAEHLGELTAEMPGGYQLWSWTDRGTTTYYVFDPRTRTSQLGTSGRAYPQNRNSFVIMGTYSGPNNQFRAADLYAFLIFGRGLTLVSDNKQSTGGYRVWQELERRYGRKLNIHGFDTKTNEPVNVTTQDEPDTHVARQDVKQAGPQMKKELGSISRDLRFVASAK